MAKTVDDEVLIRRILNQDYKAVGVGQPSSFPNPGMGTVCDPHRPTYVSQTFLPLGVFLDKDQNGLCAHGVPLHPLSAWRRGFWRGSADTHSYWVGQVSLLVTVVSAVISLAYTPGCGISIFFQPRA